MKHQESRLTGLRWYVGLVGVGCMVWAWFLSWAIVLWPLHNMVWLVEWCTWGMVACAVIVFLLPSESSNGKTRSKRSKNSETSDG